MPAAQPLEDAPAASPGAAGPSSTTGDDWPLPTPPVGATASSRPGSSTLVASSVRPAGFAIRIPVFMYHRIAPDNEVGASLAGLVVKPEQFAAQMDALELAGWHTITARTLANDLAAGRRPPRHSFVVTLDDGHEDGYTYAYPILRRDGFLATYFVITDRIGHTGYLSVRELRTMVAAGMEIASHTIRHADLTHLAPGGVRAELHRIRRSDRRRRRDTTDDLRVSVRVLGSTSGRRASRDGLSDGLHRGRRLRGRDVAESLLGTSVARRADDVGRRRSRPSAGLRGLSCPRARLLSVRLSARRRQRVSPVIGVDRRDASPSTQTAYSTASSYSSGAPVDQVAQPPAAVLDDAPKVVARNRPRRRRTSGV